MNRIALVCALACLLPVSAAAQKRRVAVMNFDYSPVHSTVMSLFGSDQDVGKGIADVLVQKLVQTGVYSVIERKAIDKIMTEQNFSNSDRADPNTAAKLGRIMGVDAIIIGSVTQFGQDQKKREIGGGALGGLAGRYGLGGVSKQESRAVVTLTGRMVNTDTGEVMAVASGQAQSSRTATSLLGSGGYWGAAGSVVDMTSQDFSNTIMGEAVNSAVSSMAHQFEGRAAQLPTHKVEIDGLVADVNGNQLVVNVGSKVGLKVGDQLEVRRKAREIRDPATNKVIRRVEDRVGELRITDVEAESAAGVYTGTSPAKVGDAVRLP